MKTRFALLSALLFFLAVSGIRAQGHYARLDAGFAEKPAPYADSLFAAMDLDRRIGQLFMVAAYSNKGQAHEAELLTLVREHHIGGLIFFQGGPLRQAHMTNRLQAAAETPLMVGIDGEWGLAMRLDSTMMFPHQMTLGAVHNDSLIYAMGAEIARQCRRLGIHVNFAPVADVNNNPRNPVINYRSFGEDRENVARKSIAYMRGMQDYGVLANAKHFPGHGDTDTDSHLALPLIRHDRSRLDSLEMYPFREMIREGLGSVMVAHLSVPALDSTPKLATTLSSKVVNGLLKTEVGFKGLVFTDALNMKGVADYYAPGEVDLMALKAGNDVLLFPEDVPKAAAVIKKALEDGRISEAEVNASVLKILRAKEALGLIRTPYVDPRRLNEDLNTPAALHLKRKLSEAAITVVRNEKALIPLKQLVKRDIGVVTVGSQGVTFKNRLADYFRFTAQACPAAPSPADGLRIREALEGKNTVIVYLGGTHQKPRSNFGFTAQASALIDALAEEGREIILVHMGNPYALKVLSNPDGLAGLVVGYRDDTFMARAAADVLGGALPASGRLPVAVGDKFKAGAGFTTADAGRLYRGDPLDFGLAPDAFAAVDSIAVEGIRRRAYPGCQILVAKDGKVVYDKNFGFHTYEDGTPVASSDVYDLASVTKIAASTISLMKLQDKGLFSLDDRLEDYFPEIPDGNPYRTVELRRMMAHQAGLVPWIPFYKNTVRKGGLRTGVYSTAQDEYHARQVAFGMYIRTDVSDSIMTRILETPLRKNKSYKYSDMGYYFVREIVHRLSGKRLDRFAEEEIYRPLGLNNIGYLPRERFSLDRIVPTEYDSYFRGQLVHGFVHDPGAAMQGGVGGHAGLFSNAYDLAVVMQMLVNGGTYGGEQILRTETVEEYVRCQFCTDERDENRRGAGFDKPVIPPGPGPTCKCVTFDSFGHSGFTGTIAWADPAENIVYIFLSNRVYPTAENNRLAKMDIRTRIQEEIYKVLRPEETADAKMRP